MIYSVNDIKTPQRDLSSLKEVRILDPDLKLKKIVIAQRLEDEPAAITSEVKRLLKAKKARKLAYLAKQ